MCGSCCCHSWLECLSRLEHWCWNIDITYCEILMRLLLRKALFICQTVYIRRDYVPVKYYSLFTTCIEAIYLHSSPHHKWIAYFNVNTKMKQACCATSSNQNSQSSKRKRYIFINNIYKPQKISSVYTSTTGSLSITWVHGKDCLRCVRSENTTR